MYAVLQKSSFESLKEKHVRFLESNQFNLFLRGESHAVVKRWGKRSIRDRNLVRVDGQFTAFTDGTSNTIALVEVGKENAVPWTAPMDFTPVKEEPLRGLIPSVNPTGFNVGMMDGSVQFLSNDIAPDKLWSRFTRSGNDNLNP